MPFDATPSEIADNICPCPDVRAAFGECDVVTSKVVPSTCFYEAFASRTSQPQRDMIQAALGPSVCPAGSFPTILGRSVQYSADDPPFRIVLDEKAAQYVGNQVSNIPNPIDDLAVNCNESLNGFFPGCSRTTGGGACNWQPVVIGEKTGVNSFDSCGGTVQLDLAFLRVRCAIAASFCLRTAFDYTYKPSCCKQTLIQDFSLSSSVTWVTDTLFKNPTTRVGSVDPSEQFIQPLRSQSFNPYEMYCDPQWCPNSPSCDPVFVDLCAYSTTTVGTSTVHACLAATGACRQWYSASTLFPTPETALLVGSHNWLLLDRLMKNYCLNSASALGDTISCGCIGYGVASIDKPGDTVYYASCSTLGIGTNCPEGIVPVVPVDGPPLVTLSGTPRVLTDPVCSNLECLSARADGSRFLTSGALQRALACPSQVCLLANMNSTFNFGNIGTGTRYISNVNQFCNGTSFSSNAPSFRVVTAPTIWFYSNVGQSVTNPNQTSILRIENVSNDANTQMNWSVSWAGAPTGGLPSWLQFQGTTSGNGVFPGQATSVQWSLGPVTESPAYFNLSLSVFLLGTASTTFSRQDLNVNFAIIDIDKPNTALPSGDDTDPNGIPLLVREKYSPGAIAMVLLIALLVFVAAGLLFQSWRTSQLVRKAEFWNSWK